MAVLNSYLLKAKKFLYSALDFVLTFKCIDTVKIIITNISRNKLLLVLTILSPVIIHVIIFFLQKTYITKNKLIEIAKKMLIRASFWLVLIIYYYLFN